MRTNFFILWVVLHLFSYGHATEDRIETLENKQKKVKNYPDY